MKFVVLAVDGSFASYVRRQGSYTVSKFRERLLKKAYKLVSGEKLPVYVEKAPQLYVLAAKTADKSEMAVLFCNIYPDNVRNAKLELDGSYEIADSLLCNVDTDGSTLKISHIPPYGYCAVLLKIKN